MENQIPGIVNEKSIKIQRWWRGSIARLKCLEIILAGMIISRKWAQWKRFSQLRERMRFIEFPVVLTLHEILNLSPSSLQFGSINIAISVWWSKNKLFSIDSYFDRASVTPNLWKASSYYPCTIIPESKTEPDDRFRYRSRWRRSSKIIPVRSLKERILKLLPNNFSKQTLFAELVRVPCRYSKIREFLAKMYLTNSTAAKQHTSMLSGSPQELPLGLKYDKIGRDCLNSIGINLLSPRRRPTSLKQQQKVKPKKGREGSLRLSNPRAVVPAILPPLRVRGFISSTGTSSVIEEQGGESESTEAHVDLQNEEIYLPCCPGGALIKFDIYDER
jgi:hypothetical protein